MSRIVVTAIAAVAVGILTGAALGGLTLKSPASHPERAATDRTGTGSEGISVHGHWVIAVSEPDGTVVETREFDNALLSVGKASLAHFLTGNQGVGSWRITLSSVSGPAPCWRTTPSNSRFACFIAESGYASTEAHAYFTNLTKSIDTNDAVVLSGHAIALLNAPAGQHTSQIRQVSTAVQRCHAATSPATGCLSQGFTSFSDKVLPTPIDVTSGQRIDVTVTFSFN